MTLPYERTRAVNQTHDFLLELCKTPRVPKIVKQQAHSLLRHYPNRWDMERIVEKEKQSNDPFGQIFGDNP